MDSPCTQLSPAVWDEYHKSRGAPLVTQAETERFLKMAPPPFGRRVADLGCGSGAWSRQLARWDAHVTGYDYSPEALRQARRHVRPEVDYKKWDINSEPIPHSLKPGSVDLVTCRLSLAYLDIARVLGDIARWLTPQGALYILSPVQDLRFDPEAPAKAEDPYLRALSYIQFNGIVDHGKRQWGRYEYRIGTPSSVIVLKEPLPF